jgi:hypothetical protein
LYAGRSGEFGIATAEENGQVGEASQKDRGGGNHDEEFVGGHAGDTIAPANTFLKLSSDTMKRAIGSEWTFDGAKRCKDTYRYWR